MVKNNQFEKHKLLNVRNRINGNWALKTFCSLHQSKLISAPKQVKKRSQIVASVYPAGDKLIQYSAMDAQNDTTYNTEAQALMNFTVN